MRVDIIYAVVVVITLRDVGGFQYALETEAQKDAFDGYLDTLNAHSVRYSVHYWDKDGAQYYDDENWR